MTRCGRRRILRELGRKQETLPLKEGIFGTYDPKDIVASIKEHVAMDGHRRCDPLRSALAMLNFYIDRTGGRLGRQRKQILKEARRELRRDLRIDHRR